MPLDDERLRSILHRRPLPEHVPIPPHPFEKATSLPSQAPDHQIERAACRALKVPHALEIEAGVLRSAHHRIGTFKIRDSERATHAAFEAYVAYCRTIGRLPIPFTYGAYQHALRSVETLKNRADRYARDPLGNVQPLSPEEAIFLRIHSHDHSTADMAGYLHYLSACAQDFTAILEKELPLYISEEARHRHTYLLGTTGSGKSELLKTLIHSYVEQSGLAAVVAVDPAGEFVSQVAHWREFVGKGSTRLVYLKHGLKLGMTPTLNPFEISGVDPADTSLSALRTKRVVAQQIVEALEQIIAGSIGSAITTQMQALLQPCVLTLLDRRGSTLRDLRRFMSTEENADLVAFGATRTHYEDAAGFFSKQFADKHYASTKSSIYTKLQSLLSTGPFADLTCGKNSIDLERMINERKIILFDLSKGNIGTDEAIAFGRLVVAMVKGIALRREHIKDQRHRVPVHVMIDECHNFITPSIEEILLEARKYNFLMTLCQQNVGYGMGPQTRNVVTGMTQSKISGLTAPDQWERVARLFRIAPSDMEGLAQGLFIAQFGIDEPLLRFRSRADLLGYQNSMTPPSWERLKHRQLRAYYRSVSAPASESDRSPPPAAESAEPWGRKRTEFI